MKKYKHVERHLIGCSDCEKKINFELPLPVVDACLEGKLVIFAGAGISTEGKNVFPFTLHDDIKAELGIKGIISFPALMTKFFEKTQDNRRLLQRIKQRIDYAKSFPDLYQSVVQFHRELSTIYQIKEILTTNWDDFFEKECGATPIVTDKDFAFWDEPYRKVFKIHGSINNPGSIIATEDDYKNCYKKLSKTAIGGSLRYLLATKTIVFCGYSLRDPDFKRIYEYLKKTMGSSMPHPYLVTLNEKLDSKIRNAPTIIKTDATYFLHKLKEKLVEKKQLVPDYILHIIFSKLLKIKKVHFSLAEIDVKRDPTIILCLSYQDGIIHAFERMVENWHTGYYSHICNIENSIKSYFKLRKAFLRKKRYFDIAYIDGYINGLFQLVPEFSKEVGFPMYYVYNSEPLYNYRSYRKSCRTHKVNVKAAYSWARKEAKKYKSGIILQHTPFLLGVNMEEA